MRQFFLKVRGLTIEMRVRNAGNGYQNGAISLWRENCSIARIEGPDLLRRGVRARRERIIQGRTDLFFQILMERVVRHALIDFFLFDNMNESFLTYSIYQYKKIEHGFQECIISQRFKD